jgi:hypothetical protein
MEAPRLVVLGDCQMRFTLTRRDGDTNLLLSIDYNVPSRGLARVFGRALAAPYVRWCLRRMARDTRLAFESRSGRGHVPAGWTA